MTRPAKHPDALASVARLMGQFFPGSAFVILVAVPKHNPPAAGSANATLYWHGNKNPESQATLCRGFLAAQEGQGTDG